MRPDAPGEAFGGTETAKSPKTPNSLDLKFIVHRGYEHVHAFQKVLPRKPSCDVGTVKAIYGKWIAMRRRSRQDPEAGMGCSGLAIATAMDFSGLCPRNASKQF